MTCIALIPARAGSKRVPDKNLKLLAGRPLICHTIRQAKAAECFSEIVVSSDHPDVLRLADEAHVTAIERPADLATDSSPDIHWVRHALTNRRADAFCILRPTSPFRRPETIREAWLAFQDDSQADSLRAVRLITEHPGKMWVMVQGTRLLPLLPFGWDDGVPWHSRPTQSLPSIVVQTSSLEFAWVSTVLGMNGGSISGQTVRPFLVSGPDAFTIDTPEDWAEAERLVPSFLPQHLA